MHDAVSVISFSTALLNELLRSSFARRMLRHIEVNDPVTIVGQDNQHKKHSQSRRK